MSTQQGQGSPYGENHCPRCGAPHDPLQEYCLECGLRLVALPRERYTRTIVWSRESPVWLWIALAALLLVALAAGGIVALAATDEHDMVAVLACREQGSFDHTRRGVVAAHGIKGDDNGHQAFFT